MHHDCPQEMKDAGSIASSLQSMQNACREAQVGLDRLSQQTTQPKQQDCGPIDLNSCYTSSDPLSFLDVPSNGQGIIVERTIGDTSASARLNPAITIDPKGGMHIDEAALHAELAAGRPVVVNEQECPISHYYGVQEGRDLAALAQWSGGVRRVIDHGDSKQRLFYGAEGTGRHGVARPAPGALTEPSDTPSTQPNDTPTTQPSDAPSTQPNDNTAGLPNAGGVQDGSSPPVPPATSDAGADYNAPDLGGSFDASKAKGNVYYIAPDGNDDAGGTSANSASKTWDAALSHLQSGDTLVVEDGTYTMSNNGALNADGNQLKNPDGSPVTGVTIIAQHQRQANIQGDGATLDAAIQAQTSFGTTVAGVNSDPGTAEDIYDRIMKSLAS